MLYTNFAKFSILFALSTMLNACSAQTSPKQSGQVSPYGKKPTPKQNMTDKEKEELRKKGNAQKTAEDGKPPKKENPNRPPKQETPQEEPKLKENTKALAAINKINEENGEVSDVDTWADVGKYNKKATFSISSREKQMYREINMVRANPKGYIKFVETYLAYQERGVAIPRVPTVTTSTRISGGQKTVTRQIKN
jgi:hypothetical protein